MNNRILSTDDWGLAAFIMLKLGILKFQKSNLNSRYVQIMVAEDTILDIEYWDDLYRKSECYLHNNLVKKLLPKQFIE